MRPEDVREVRDAEPFVPFRICLTDGKTYDVPHRDFLMISRTVIDIGIATDPTSRIYDRIVRVSPLHIVRIDRIARRFVAQASKPAVSPTSSRLAVRETGRIRVVASSAGWKPATQQAWKPALRQFAIAEDLLNAGLFSQCSSGTGLG